MGRAWRAAGASLLLTAAAACAHRGGGRAAAPPPPEPGYTSTVAQEAGWCRGEGCRTAYDASRHQYFDERRRRYYYFDRQKKKYFWENGDPKT